MLETEMKKNTAALEANTLAMVAMTAALLGSAPDADAKTLTAKEIKAAAKAEAKAEAKAVVDASEKAIAEAEKQALADAEKGDDAEDGDEKGDDAEDGDEDDDLKSDADTIRELCTKVLEHDNNDGDYDRKHLKAIIKEAGGENIDSLKKKGRETMAAKLREIIADLDEEAL